MRVRALKPFEKINDLLVDRPRKEGEEFEVTEKRAELLLSRGLIEVIEEEKNENSVKRRSRKKN